LLSVAEKANPDLGVMRFLQLEWHNHERARNAWDIERAEKLNDQLNKHIRMLEQALMNERAKAKSGAVGGDATDDKKDVKGKKAANAVKREYCDTVDSK
jgi:striatin 1/3/4